MKHAEFLALSEAGKIVAGIDSSLAIRLLGGLPRRYQAAFKLWSWVWFLSIPGFVAVSIFVEWWVGLLLLIFVTPIMGKSVKETASQFVIEHAIESEAFFDALVVNGYITIRKANAE